MKTYYKIMLLLVAFVFGISSLFAEGDIVSASDFMNLIKSDKNLVIVDANKAANYKTSHIKDAVNIPHTELYQEGDIEGLIKSPDALAKYFGSKGVSNTNTIIIYDDGSHKYDSRVYWILKYLGAENVKVLHKDLDEWRKARIPITRTPTAAKSATFTAKPDASILAKIDYVKANKDKANVVLVDARNAEEYNGTSEEPESKGHISGAINLNYEDLLTSTGAYKTKDEIEALAKKHGLTSDKELILYCRTSVRAAVPFLAFKSILGYSNVKVYDGAYNEWIAKYPDAIEK